MLNNGFNVSLFNLSDSFKTILCIKDNLIWNVIVMYQYSKGIVVYMYVISVFDIA